LVEQFYMERVWVLISHYRYKDIYLNALLDVCMVQKIKSWEHINIIWFSIGGCADVYDMSRVFITHEENWLIEHYRNTGNLIGYISWLWRTFYCGLSWVEL